MTTYHTPPEEQGQIVTASWAGAGEAGAVECIYDASDGTAAYRLHPWLSGGSAFEPWNGDPVGISCARRSRKLTEAEASALVDGAGE